ncbi:MAG: NifB/NifX family molybdenum-iron cluster-binding protein [Thermodesulfobacteriota bacterium]|jgi:predicted Fe-Mo cluster-binding NifX family protein
MKKGISLVVVLVMLVVAMLAFAGEKAKIAVAANDKTPSAAVSKQAGLAPFFLFFDGKGKMTEAIENPYKDKEGAGKSVAELLGNKGVTVVVAEEFGGQIVEVMKGKGIKAVSFKGSAEEAVKKILQPK